MLETYLDALRRSTLEVALTRVAMDRRSLVICTAFDHTLELVEDVAIFSVTAALKCNCFEAWHRSKHTLKLAAVSWQLLQALRPSTTSLRHSWKMASVDMCSLTTASSLSVAVVLRASLRQNLALGTEKIVTLYRTSSASLEIKRLTLRMTTPWSGCFAFVGVSSSMAKNSSRRGFFSAFKGRPADRMYS